MTTWERKRILIWGKTRPELSQSYKEIVCTGGVFADTKKFVRLYPIPLRFLDDERLFRKYQWIEADVTKARRDPRPESYHIRCDTITVGERIETERGNWDARAEWIMQPGHIFASVQAIQDARLDKQRGNTIGLVKPAEVLEIYPERISQADKDDFWRRFRNVQQQRELPFARSPKGKVKPLSPPDFRFKIKFRCDDPADPKDHTFSVLDWEVDALYFRCRQQGDDPDEAARKVVAKLEEDTCIEEKDIYFFLGNMAAHPHVFLIVGLWYPKKKAAKPAIPSLFD